MYRNRKTTTTTTKIHQQELRNSLHACIDQLEIWRIKKKTKNLKVNTGRKELRVRVRNSVL